MSIHLPKYTETRRDEKTEKVWEWLSNIQPSADYDKARKKITPSTCKWFLESESFSKWLTGEAESSMLWLYGIRKFQLHSILLLL
jgi:hypothetical protein